MLNPLTAELERGIAAIAADRESGASDILDAVIGLLRKVREGDVAVAPIARAICRSQPSMAPVWTASIEAIADELEPGRFDRFAHRVAQAPKALARFATEFFKDEQSERLQLVTISLSRSVTTVLDAIGCHRAIQVACSESRPALEGRVLATRLAQIGVPITFYSDAAIAHALVDADAVMLGADAVTAEWVLNKSGSYMLAAAAAQRGIPVYVAATREKFVGPAVARRLVIREGSPDEIWQTPPPGVEVRNPYFEDIARSLQHEHRAYSGECHPTLDVIETDAAMEVIVDVSGIQAAALRVLFRDGVLIIAGEKAPTSTTDEQTFHLVEREFGRFARAVRLAGAFDIQHARATVSEGELTIMLPKLVERRGQGHRIPVVRDSG